VFDAKIVEFLAGLTGLSYWQQRNKKIFQSWDFLLGVPAQMIENLA